MNQNKLCPAISLGRKGEDAACRFLKRQAYTILFRNYRTPFGEIDIVAEKNGTLIFCEVKSRRSERFGPPLSAITGKKAATIVQNGHFFLKRFGLTDRKCRIDAIGITFRDEEQISSIVHVPNAVQERR